MTDQDTTTTETKPETNGPTLHAYSVREGKKRGSKGYWTRIGAVFPHKDGLGYDIMLDALPLTDRVVIRPPLPKDEA